MWQKKTAGFRRLVLEFSAVFAFRPLDRQWGVRTRNKQSEK